MYTQSHELSISLYKCVKPKHSLVTISLAHATISLYFIIYNCKYRNENKNIHTIHTFFCFLDVHKITNILLTTDFFNKFGQF